MPYATSAQAIDLYGSAYVTVACDRDGNGSVDTTALNKWLEVATRKMNGYLLGRYTLPLATPPEYFQQLCVDIALYYAAATADVATEIIKERHKEAIEYLELIAANKVKLEISTDTTAANAPHTPQVSTKSTIEIVSDDRQMRRDALKELL